MDTRIKTYPVAGGWHAEDRTLFITCFGSDELSARSALEEARKQAKALSSKADEMRRAGTLYGALPVSESV